MVGHVPSMHETLSSIPVTCAHTHMNACTHTHTKEEKGEKEREKENGSY